MRYEKRKLVDIKPYDANPRKNSQAVEDVAESIKQCGYIAPIVVDEDGVILAGHTRYAALNLLGYEECSVIVAEGISDEVKRKYRLLDNKTGEKAGWDYELLDAELSEVDFDGYDFGFAMPADIDIDSLFGNAEPKAKKVKTATCPECGATFEIE